MQIALPNSQGVRTELQVNPAGRDNNTQTGSAAPVNRSNRQTRARSSLDKSSAVQLVPYPIANLSVRNVQIAPNSSSANRSEASTLLMVNHPSHLASDIADSLSDLHEHRSYQNRVRDEESIADPTVAKYQTVPANSLLRKTCVELRLRIDQRIYRGRRHDYSLIEGDNW